MMRLYAKPRKRGHFGFVKMLCCVSDVLLYDFYGCVVAAKSFFVLR